ncbi:hypothetical protein, variant [Aphanomyces invadans]|uniref:Uncharacterized protein n=1 Tax=Aphanomyces invadans TaxID=157072 RepID=A0A024U1H7_9STRA|nr:hypothetical protein, variant [Aphanomyces invadans]ETW00281.1 hypothetical protein, variant [Aphanomyces invadans]|eukprot:XP_008871306.1 hypothetical protein, variant [Aphanomyces invadans]
MRQNHGAVASAELRKDHMHSMKKDKEPTPSTHQLRLLHFTAHARQKLAAKREIHDMVNYVIFLALFLTVAIMSTNGDDLFKFSKLVRSHLAVRPFQLINTSVYKSYADVSNLDEFYEYLVGPFWGALYGGDSYDGDVTLPSVLNTTTTNKTYVNYNRGYLGGVGRILGTIRLGQVRVAAHACDNLAPEGSTWCFPEYSSSTASTESFGLGHEPYEAVHTHLDEPRYISITNRVYPGPDFTVEIPNTESIDCDVMTKEHCTVYKMLDDLRANKFWDLATRAIFVDLSVYNPHCNALAVVRLFLEQTDGGGIMPSISVRPFVAHLSFDSTQTSFMLVCEGLLYLVVCHQAFVAVRSLRTVGIKYYAVRANIANDINIVFFFVVLGLKVLTHASMPTEFQDDVYVNVRSSANYDYLSRSVNSLNCFLSVLKVFKYLSFIPTFSVLTATVSGAVDELIGLFAMIAILLFGGSLAFTIAFGTMLRHYSIVVNSFYSLMGIFTLKFDAEEIFDGNRVLGPLFFVVFVSLIILVIMHMLIACFANAYLEQKQTQMQPKETQLHTLGADICDHILHNMIFAMPVVGHRVFLPLYIYAMKAMKDAPALTSGDSRMKSTDRRGAVHLLEEKSSREAVKAPGTNRVYPIQEDPTAVESDDGAPATFDNLLREMAEERMAFANEVELMLKHLNELQTKQSVAHARELVQVLATAHELEERLNSNLHEILE